MRVSGPKSIKYCRNLLPQFWQVGGNQIAVPAHTKDERIFFRSLISFEIRRFLLHEFAFVRKTRPQADIARDERPSVIGQL